jgi:hypothetical protein
MLDLQHALLFEPLRGLANDSAADAELLCQRAFGGKPAFLFGTGATDELGELLTDAFHEGCGTFECGDIHRGMERGRD